MIDELVDLTARSPMVEAAVDLHSEEAAKTVDGYIADVIGFRVADVVKRSSLRVNHGGTLNSSAITARIYSGSDDGESFPLYMNKTRLSTSSTVVGQTKSGMTYKTIRHGVSVLESKNARRMNDGYFHGFMHPTVAYQLETSAGFKGWLKYTDTTTMRQNSLGIVAGTKFYKSTETPKFALSGDTLDSGSGILHGTIIVGRGAYSVTEIPKSGQSKGFKIYIKGAGSAGTADPVSQKQTVGWKMTMAAKVTNKSAGVILLSTSVV